MTVQEAQTWLQARVGQSVYLHLESNPQGYIRNAEVTLKSGHIHGDGPYRIYVQWDNPTGLVQLNEVTDIYEDEHVLIFTAYDTQTRISHNLEISTQPLSM